MEMERKDVTKLLMRYLSRDKVAEAFRTLRKEGRIAVCTGYTMDKIRYENIAMITKNLEFGNKIRLEADGAHDFKTQYMGTVIDTRL